jgi:hypothetical protein
MKVEDKPLTMPPTGKTEEVWQAESDFRTGFLVDSGGDRPAGRDRQETARFPRASSSNPADPPAPSVSHILRRNARSRVRLNDRALNLKQRASNTPASLN